VGAVWIGHKGVRTAAPECEFAILKHVCPNNLLICPNNMWNKAKMSFFSAHFHTILASPLQFLLGFDAKPIFLKDSSF